MSMIGTRSLISSGVIIIWGAWFQPWRAIWYFISSTLQIKICKNGLDQFLKKVTWKLIGPFINDITKIWLYNNPSALSICLFNLFYYCFRLVKKWPLLKDILGVRMKIMWRRSNLLILQLTLLLKARCVQKPLVPERTTFSAAKLLRNSEHQEWRIYHYNFRPMVKINN